MYDNLSCGSLKKSQKKSMLIYNVMCVQIEKSIGFLPYLTFNCTKKHHFNHTTYLCSANENFLAKISAYANLDNTHQYIKTLHSISNLI